MRASSILLNFLRKRVLGPIACDHTRLELLQLLGPPEDFDGSAEKMMTAKCWAYGNVQIHFEGNRIGVFGIYVFKEHYPAWADVGRFPNQNTSVGDMKKFLDENEISYQERIGRALILESGVKVVGRDTVMSIICDCIALPEDF